MAIGGTTGYIWNFVVYTGGNTKYNEQYRELPITAQIVCTLCNPLFGKGYCLYTDNFYTSPSLADILVSKQNNFVGTLRLNRRDVPQKVKEAKLKKLKLLLHSKIKDWKLKNQRSLWTIMPIWVELTYQMVCCVNIRQQDLE